jgi:WD repeat-containing protein 48
LEELLSHPLTPPSHSEAPPLVHSPSMALVISEEVDSNWIPVYRGTVSTTGTDARILEEKMPMWLLEYLLFNKTPSLAVIKIGFSLLPMPTKNAAEEGDQLPELVNKCVLPLSGTSGYAC